MPTFVLHPEPWSGNPCAWDFPDNATGQFPTEPHDELGAISTVLRAVYGVCAAVGLFFTLTFLYVIVAHSSGQLKPYSRMLLLCSISDLCYWVTDNFLQVKAKLKDGVYMVKFEGPAAHLSYEHQALAMSVYVYTLALAHTIIPAQYYFRYYAVTRSQPLTAVQTVAMFLVASALAMPMALVCYPSYRWSCLERPGFNYGTLWYDEVPLPAVLYADIRYIYQKLYFCYSNFLVSFIYAMSLYLALKTVKYLKTNSHMYSERTKQMQSQLSKTMMPLVVSIFPILAICVPSFFNIDTGVSALIFMNMMGWIPVFNPLLAIVFIVPYRRAVLRWFTRTKVTDFSTNKSTSKNETINADELLF